MSMQIAITVDHGPAALASFPGMPWMLASSTAGLGEAALAQSKPALRFTQDSPIYDEGDKAKLVYKVVSGVVRTCKFLSDGRRQIDAFYGAGEMFGLEIGSAHRLCAEAVSDCIVIPYHRHGLEQLAATDGQFARQFVSYAMRCLARAQDHSLLLGRRSAVQKVAAFLLDLSERSAGDDVIDLPMARHDIGDYLGLTIETVSRTMTQLERDGVIAMPTARRIRLSNRLALEDLNA